MTRLFGLGLELGVPAADFCTDQLHRLGPSRRLIAPPARAPQHLPIVQSTIVLQPDDRRRVHPIEWAAPAEVSVGRVERVRIEGEPRYAVAVLPPFGPTVSLPPPGDGDPDGVAEFPSSSSFSSACRRIAFTR